MMKLIHIFFLLFVTSCTSIPFFVHEAEKDLEEVDVFIDAEKDALKKIDNQLNQSINQAVLPPAIK